MKLTLMIALVAALPLTVALARNQTPATPSPVGGPSTTPVGLYNGGSPRGVLQEALDDSMSKASAALGKTGAAGQPFAWTLGPVGGTQGGKPALTQIDVQVQVPLVPGGATR